MLSRLARRKFPLSSQTAASFSSSSKHTQPLIEFREYVIPPKDADTYIKATTDYSDLRRTMSPLRFFAFPEVGGALSVASHLYHYEGGFEQRTACRAVMMGSGEWMDYLKIIKPCVATQKSSMYLEAPVAADLGACGLKVGVAENQIDMYNADGTGSKQADCVLEIRKYDLKLGSDTLAEFFKLYQTGMAGKLKTCDPTTSLVSVLHTEVGQSNEVVEIWRHGGGLTAVANTCAGERESASWMKAMNGIASLANSSTNIVYKPLSFSPVR